MPTTPSGSSRATRSSSGPTARCSPARSRHEEAVLVAELDLGKVKSARRLFDPVGHYHRPDVFRLSVDTAPRPVVTTFASPLTDRPEEPAGDTRG